MRKKIKDQDQIIYRIITGSNIKYDSTISIVIMNRSIVYDVLKDIEGTPL